MSRSKFEAAPINRAKGNDGFHRVMIHRDANKNPSGVDKIAERKDLGYEIEQDNASFVIMKQPIAEFNANHKRQAERFANLDGSLSGDRDAIEDKVVTGQGDLNDD